MAHESETLSLCVSDVDSDIDPCIEEASDTEEGEEEGEETTTSDDEDVITITIDQLFQQTGGVLEKQAPRCSLAPSHSMWEDSARELHQPELRSGRGGVLYLSKNNTPILVPNWPTIEEYERLRPYAPLWKTHDAEVSSEMVADAQAHLNATSTRGYASRELARRHNMRNIVLLKVSYHRGNYSRERSWYNQVTGMSMIALKLNRQTGDVEVQDFVTVCPASSPSIAFGNVCKFLTRRIDAIVHDDISSVSEWLMATWMPWSGSLCRIPIYELKCAVIPPVAPPASCPGLATGHDRCCSLCNALQFLSRIVHPHGHGLRLRELPRRPQPYWKNIPTHTCRGTTYLDYPTVEAFGTTGRKRTHSERDRRQQEMPPLTCTCDLSSE